MEKENNSENVKKTQTVDTYITHAAAFAEKFDVIGARTEDIEKVFSYKQEISNPVTLEIGCGNGRDALEITKHTQNYLGIDISPAFIEMARQKVTGGHFEVADIESFQFPEKYDIVISFASLLHEDKTKLANILNRVSENLKPLGILKLSLKYGEYQEVREQNELGVRFFYFYTPEDIKNMIGDRFTVLEEKIQNVRNASWTEMTLQKS